MRILSHFISVLFHPVFFPLYCTLIIMYSFPLELGTYSVDDRIQLMQRVIINGFFFPLVAIFILKGLKMIKSFINMDRTDRMAILIVVMFFYIWLFISFQKAPIEGEIWLILTTIFLAATAGVIISFLITILFFNVSLHTVGCGTLIAILLSLVPIVEFSVFPYIILAVLLSGAVGSARLILGHHKPREVFTGYAVGFLSFFAAILII